MWEGLALTVTIGRYLLHEPIGRGGMAEVWRATLEGPMGYAKEVAIKRVPAQLTEDDNYVKALVNEARIGGLLRHPNLVEFYELDHVDGEWLICMELLRGRTLKEILDHCRVTEVLLPPAVIAEIARQIVAGLQYAHTFRAPDGGRVGLVHRDLKPANVMLTDRGEIKIMDFGLARASLDYYLQSTGQMMAGTPLYMSPEQVDGAPLTPASDLFALGTMLVEMATNRRLFQAASLMRVFARIQGMDLAPTLDEVRQVDPVLAAVAERCLERDVDRRVQSELEIHEMLSRVSMAPGAPTLAEFVFYLQRAPMAGLTPAGGESGWSWSSRGADDPDEGDERAVHVARPLDEIAGSLQSFGDRFFTPVEDVDAGAETREYEAQRRRGALATAPGEPERTSGQEASAPAADPRPSAPVQEAGGTRSRWPVPVFGALVLALGVVVVVLLLQRSNPREGAPPDIAAMAAAVDAGDWRRAGTLVTAARNDPAPDAALIRAVSAALSGEHERSIEELEGVDSWPEPARSRGWVMRGGALRLASEESACPSAATEAYARALSCSGDECAGIRESAAAGLATCCAVRGEDEGEACSRLGHPEAGE